MVDAESSADGVTATRSSTASPAAATATSGGNSLLPVPDPEETTASMAEVLDDIVRNAGRARGESKQRAGQNPLLGLRLNQ